MISRALRRSGVAMLEFAELLNWKPDHVYQVGIGVGAPEVVVMREMWPDLEFTGFEPHPDIIAGQTPIYPGTIHPYAIADFVGKATLHTRKKHKDGSSLFPHASRDMQVEVEVTTLDTFYPDGPPHKGQHLMLWLDCEGSELMALRGGERFLRHFDMLNVEMTGAPNAEPDSKWACHCDLHQWLAERYWMRVFIHTIRKGAGQADAFYCRPEFFNPRYCCCPCAIRLYREWEERGCAS